MSNSSEPAESWKAHLKIAYNDCCIKPPENSELFHISNEEIRRYASGLILVGDKIPLLTFCEFFYVLYDLLDLVTEETPRYVSALVIRRFLEASTKTEWYSLRGKLSVSLLNQLELNLLETVEKAWCDSRIDRVKSQIRSAFQ